MTCKQKQLETRSPGTLCCPLSNSTNVGEENDEAHSQANIFSNLAINISTKNVLLPVLQVVASHHEWDFQPDQNWCSMFHDCEQSLILGKNNSSRCVENYLCMLPPHKEPKIPSLTCKFDRLFMQTDKYRFLTTCSEISGSRDTGP